MGKFIVTIGEGLIEVCMVIILEMRRYWIEYNNPIAPHFQYSIYSKKLNVVKNSL